MAGKKYTVTSFSMDEETEMGRDLIKVNEGGFGKWLKKQIAEYVKNDRNKE